MCPIVLDEGGKPIKTYPYTYAGGFSAMQHAARIRGSVLDEDQAKARKKFDEGRRKADAVMTQVANRRI